jgi:hypothetical protein
MRGHWSLAWNLSRFLLIGNLLHIYPQLASLTSVVEIIGNTLHTEILKRNFSLLSNPHTTITYKDQLAFFTPICRNHPCKWKILVLDTKCLSIGQDKKKRYGRLCMQVCCEKNCNCVKLRDDDPCVLPSSGCCRWEWVSHPLQWVTASIRIPTDSYSSRRVIMLEGSSGL